MFDTYLLHLEPINLYSYWRLMRHTIAESVGAERKEYVERDSLLKVLPVVEEMIRRRRG